jgi:hypothetical protein
MDLTCCLCKIKEGACIQCDEKKCNRAFHVTCAIDYKLILPSEQMNELFKVDEWNIKVFCDRH